MKLDDSTRYLLSTHRRVVKVKENGIDFHSGKTRYVYRNSQTDALFDKKVLIWFDPESPDVAYVTDLRRQNPFAVERSNALHPTEETPENIAKEMRKLHEHQASTRAIYRALKAEFKPIFRRNIVSPDVVATGRAFQEGAKEIRQKRAKRDGDLTSLNRLSAETGIPIPGDARNIARTLEGMKGEAQFWRATGRRMNTVPKSAICPLSITHILAAAAQLTDPALAELFLKQPRLPEVLRWLQWLAPPNILPSPPLTPRPKSRVNPKFLKRRMKKLPPHWRKRKSIGRPAHSAVAWTLRKTPLQATA
jgi:hypothetical protein